MACPAAATCLRMPGSEVACVPIGKKIALVQCAASAASTAGVFLGHGPSSKVSTTSPSRKKSWLLKCSKPKPGPPVVSISTTRARPSASALPAQVGAATGRGAGAAASAAGGAAGEACARVGVGTARDEVTSATTGPGLAPAGVAPPGAVAGPGALLF